MTTVTMTESALRDLINEALDNKTMAKSVMDPFALSNQVNPVVSPAAPYDAPLNPDFTPQDRPEFVVAMQRAVQGFEDTDIPKLYKAIIDALEEFGIDPTARISREAEDDDEEKRSAALNGSKKDDRNMKKSDTKEEALVRAAVRKMINEARPAAAKKPTKKFGKLPDEEDDPEPFDAGPEEYAAWEERQAERDRRRAMATRGTHEKNIMTDVPQTRVSKALGMKNATYVKGEHQVLNKFVSILLDPTTPKSQREAQKARYIRTLFEMYINQLAVILSDADPDVEDPATAEFMTRMEDPAYRDQLYMGNFQQWYQDQLELEVDGVTAKLSGQLKAAGSTEEKQTIREKIAELKRVYRELSALPTSLGAGYGRLDQDPVAFERLRRLYQSQWGEDEAPVALQGVPARSGGRKAQAGRAVGKTPDKKKAPTRRRA